MSSQGTTRVEDFVFDHPAGLRIHLIDTPGFDDTNKSDTDVLKDIANWLAQSYKRQERLSGILFLHPISLNRITSGALRNLSMFKKLCGEDNFASVVLATTHWDEVNPQVGAAREHQLKTTTGMWEDMIKGGSQYLRHDQHAESAQGILDYMIERRQVFTLAIQHELVEEGASLLTTQAGQRLAADLLATEERHRQDLIKIQKNYEEAQRQRDSGALVQYQRLKRETQLQVDGEKRARLDLQANLDTLKREKQDEIRRNQETTARQMAEISRVRMSHTQDQEQMEGQIRDLQVQLESLGRKNGAQVGEGK
ncbi:hypothetical protein N0V83_000088 [Neocucurbitaria cava]|uniref:G domain-containing protein n=1 Tax=Neocucurbitaria cava TaxID=798079 RepID=A0A9W8YG06_9PLEO|nr:hypothetical protein N0V83_000088 [Neocucurbitaria cava]